jgi:hypothetical protein
VEQKSLLTLQHASPLTLSVLESSWDFLNPSQQKPGKKFDKTRSKYIVIVSTMGKYDYEDENNTMDDYHNEKTGDSSLAGSKRSPVDSHGGDDSGDDDGKDDEFDFDPEKRREARKMRRVMANRRSARESRERRKKLLSDLQESVESLTSENTTLTRENLSLRRELASLIEQAGGAASLSMIPNIQSLLSSTKDLSELTVPPSTPGGGSAGEGSSSSKK